MISGKISTREAIKILFKARAIIWYSRITNMFEFLTSDRDDVYYRLFEIQRIKLKKYLSQLNEEQSRRAIEMKHNKEKIKYNIELLSVLLSANNGDGYMFIGGVVIMFTVLALYIVYAFIQ